MGVEIANPVPVEDASEWVRTLASGLFGNPYEPEFERRVRNWASDWEPERTWGVRAGERFVATLATEPRVLTVPAGASGTRDLPVDALTGVSVAATHRRRGILTRMLRQSLAAARERGDAVSALIAAEWPIYGRFGYGPATLSANYTYRPRMSAVPGDPVATVRQVEPAEVLERAAAIFERARQSRPGQVDRGGNWWDRALGLGGEPVGGRKHWFLREGPDGPDGLLAWLPSRDFELDGSFGAIKVDNLVAATDAAYRDLWAYLGGIDIVGEIELGDRPVDEQVRYLLADGRALHQDFAGDFLWLALLDLPAALTARGYASSGRLVLDVVDDSVMGYAAGRVLLDATPDGATCAPTTQSADLVLPARVLAAAYLGGHSLRELAIAGGVVEQSPGALDRLDTMLAVGLAPWNQTGF